ncbi:fasciclin domain-containing protein [Nonlabens marinus]|uniref:Secreted and surface protein containing fasciclin-like repeats n=1 Tax=Nonlabens marinus S1-08 TaxID=1454201 RepID=W8VWH4_9FLAO|nr:fasciclin domain-containing protein [Nonlabens marinus]BAO54737.1 secreted and surface protein containing fasciclin-like repeats [Nonlabens marinus S1-08]
MKIKNYVGVAFTAVALFIGQATFAQYDKAEKTIVETAIATEDLSTLVAAVKAADLVDALSSEGPFTVFAPTNTAFEALPEGTVTTLLKPENKSALAGILTYHVVSGDVKAADVLQLIENGNATVETLAGGTLTFWTKDGKAYVQDENENSAEIIMPNVATSNGTVHVINSVLLPKK